MSTFTGLVLFFVLPTLAKGRTDSAPFHTDLSATFCSQKPPFLGVAPYFYTTSFLFLSFFFYLRLRTILLEFEKKQQSSQVVNLRRCQEEGDGKKEEGHAFKTAGRLRRGSRKWLAV